MHAIFDGEFVAPAFAVIELLPGHAFVFGEARQFRFFLVQADADDFKSVGMVFFVGLDHAGQFSAAGRAPGGPEIKEDHLAFVAGNGKRLARHVFLVEVGEFGSFHQGAFHLLRLSLLLD